MEVSNRKFECILVQKSARSQFETKMLITSDFQRNFFEHSIKAFKLDAIFRIKNRSSRNGIKYGFITF